jgi:hypothetical protein
LFTTPEGTLAALRAAGELARNLRLRITLIALKVVSFHHSLDHPPVSVNFLKERLLHMVHRSGIEAEEVNTKLYLCRDQKQGLQRVLAPASLVVVGGRKRWWRRREQELARYLHSLDHRVLFVDVRLKSQNKNRSPIYSR